MQEHSNLEEKEEKLSTAAELTEVSEELQTDRQTTF